MTDLCNHDWVGDDECRYCICEALVERIAELEQALEDASAECTGDCSCMVKLDIALTLSKEIDND